MTTLDSLGLLGCRNIYYMTKPILPLRCRFITTILSMGLALSEPLTDKTSTSCENHSFAVGSSAMQGWRISIFFQYYIKFNTTLGAIVATPGPV